MKWLSLFVLAFAVSLDGLGVGVSYGVRRIRLPWWSLTIITILTASLILLAMGLGELVLLFLSPAGAKLMGAFILILLGVWAVYNLLSQKESPASTEASSRIPLFIGDFEPRVFSFELKKLGIVIQILKTPSAADMDKSGSINSSEALLLGLALSMDAFGAGIGASLVGFPAWVTAFSISAMSLLFIGIGLKIGNRYAKTPLIRRMAFLPGILLILMGLTKMFS